VTAISHSSTPLQPKDSTSNWLAGTPLALFEAREKSADEPKPHQAMSVREDFRRVAQFFRDIEPANAPIVRAHKFRSKDSPTQPIGNPVKMERREHAAWRRSPA